MDKTGNYASRAHLLNHHSQTHRVAAQAACTLGQHPCDAPLCVAAERIRDQEHAHKRTTEQHLYDQTVAAARAALEDGRFEQAWATGRTLSLEGAVSYTLAESPER